jgi:hypothetical protein
MGDLQGRLCLLKLPQIIHHFFAHRYKGVAAFQKIFCERDITGAAFVRDDIIRKRNDTGMSVPSHPSQDGTESRAHQGKPVSYNDEVGTEAAKLFAYEPPVKRIYAVHP